MKESAARGRTTGSGSSYLISSGQWEEEKTLESVKESARGLGFGISGQSIDSKPVQSISKERFFQPRIQLTSTSMLF